MHKEELLHQILIDRRQLERYLFYFEKDRSGKFVPSKRLKFKAHKMEEKGVVADWSAKDILAHLSGWESYFLGWFNQNRHNEGSDNFPSHLSWEDRDEISQLIYTRAKDLPLDEVLDEFRTSYKRILAIVEMIPENELTSINQFAWTSGKPLIDYASQVTWKHYRWAKVNIRKWSRGGARRDKDKEGMLKSIETERRRLDKNLTLLTREQMVQPGVIGHWSVKDILAHLVDWEQRFLGWYQAGLRGEIPQTPAPGMTWRDLDKLNQQIYEENKDRSLASVMDEFKKSYQQVLDTVSRIPEEDIFTVGHYAWTGKGNLTVYILANTANHYRWAKTQIRKWVRESK